MSAAQPIIGGRPSPWTRSNPCLVCGGHPSLPQGKGLRCYGFLSGGGQMAHCTREEHRGQLDYYRTKSGETLNTFGHWLAGDCRCGLMHGSAAPTDAVRSRRAEKTEGPFLWSISDSHVEMIHEYRLGGALLWQLCRFWPQYRTENKAKAKPRHVGPDGRWYLGQGPWKGQQKPLYRQDEAVNELRQGGKVFITEGERDADAVWDVGCIAVCNPDGAGSFREHQARTLVEAMREGSPAAEIVIVADDDEAGIGHAQTARRMLVGMDSTLKHRIEVVLPPLGCKDVAEFLSRGGASHG